MYQRGAWVTVDLSAIAHNVSTLKGLTAPGTLFMAVVKSDAYGHGAVPVARRAIDAGADRLGVATVEEAISLRTAEIDQEIHILSEPPQSAVPDLLKHELIPTVTTRDFAVKLGVEAASAGRTARYHLEIDTGMNRIGVRAEESAEFLRSLSDFPGLSMEGVFTHFATADIPEDWDFQRQMRRFLDALESLRDEGIDPGIVHAANSAATIFQAESHFGMVRCGLGIFGMYPSPQAREVVKLSPAMSVRAKVSFVKRIGMGEGVSYGFTWRAVEPSTIVTLPLGYADGVHRAASDKMQVLLASARCPQVGRICMDQMMVALPRGSGAAIGDEVVIVGVQGDERIDMEELAHSAETINYELACAFGLRLPRRYV